MNKKKKINCNGGQNEDEWPPNTQESSGNMGKQGTTEIYHSQGDCYPYGVVRVSGTRRWLMVTCQRQRPRYRNVFCNDGQFILC